MSDQGSAGQWRPANSHSGPYSEQDEPTGPLPEVSGRDSAASAFPPVSGQPGSWADDDAPTGGFPTVSASEQSPQAARRERAPFEPADPATPAPEGSGESGESGESGASGGYGGFGAPAEFGAGPSAEPTGSFSAGGSFGAEPPAERDGSFGAEPPAEPEVAFQPTTAFPSVPEEETPSFGHRTVENSSGPNEPVRPETEPGSTPPFGAESPQVAPYDARDATYGYEVADPSFGFAPAHPTRAAGVDTGPAADGAGPGPASEPYSFESLLGPGDGVAGPATPPGPPPGPPAAGPQPYDDVAPSRPFPGPGAFQGAPGVPPSPAGGPVSAEDQAAENDFFSHGDDPAMWDRPIGPSGPPPQPGKPSSGNLRLPDWMRDQNGDGAAGGPTAPSTGGYDDYDGFEEKGRSKRPLLAVVGVLVVGLVAAGGAYFLTAGKKSDHTASSSPSHKPKAATSKKAGQPADDQPEKPLTQFKGAHTRPVGHISDTRAGLTYPKLGKPWQMQTQKSAMAELGFSAGQFAVSEPKRWGRLLSAELGGANKDAYGGPGTERAAATKVADSYEAKLYGYTHHKRVLASQSLNVDGHKGWLVGYYLTYRQHGVKTTGELFTVAVVDTGKKAPGVLLMTVPNTDKKLWPDVNYVMRSIKVA
ncbi:hypothetical protein AB0L00_03915 [Actinoallomurus sp. NPDC052308]|uniref:hypothetical protein n=1 Tax=Actinoallomurus sp. NPDC052308 TaxID=3155530 RepID=UPI003416EF69